MKQNNINQKELAKQIETTEMTISRYVRGERQPNAETLSKLATALNTTTDNLLSREISNTIIEDSNFVQICKMVNKNRDELSEKEKYELIKLIVSGGF